MNNLLHYSKIIALSLLVVSMLSSCSKEDIESKQVCDHVSIKLTNNLDETIKDLFLEGVEVGDLKSGETIDAICLDLITTDSGVYPYLNIIGEYEGESTGQYMIICGTGMTVEDSGTYEVEITSLINNIFYYEVL